ncbi:MAG: CARDB domain-containing protein [Candidatus Pacebacteria bacterium]|nr:CARDB domain-containing protein [Candidatus Paceibacterota bacterium]
MPQKFKIISALIFILAFFYFIDFTQAQSPSPTACSYNSQCYGDFYTNVNTKCKEGFLPYCLDNQCQCSKYCSNDSDCSVMCEADKKSKCEVEVSQYSQKFCQPCSNACLTGTDCSYLQCSDNQESYCNTNQQCACRATDNPLPKNFYNVNVRMVDQNNQMVGSGAEVSLMKVTDSGEGVVASCFISDTGSGASCSAVLPKGNYKALISSFSNQFFTCVSLGCPLNFSVIDKNLDLILKISKATNVPSNFCKEYGGRDYFTKGSVIANFIGYVDSCRGGGMLYKNSCSGGRNSVTKFQCSNGCYDGACVQLCDSGYECKSGEKLDSFRLQCPNQKIKLDQLYGPHCNALGGNYCVACKPECDVNADCLEVSCSTNQIPQCVNEKCLCQNVSPDLTIISDIYYQQKVYNVNDLISGLSINIKNIGSVSTLIAPKVNLYDTTNNQQWRILSQVATSGALNIGASAAVSFGSFSFSAPGIYNLRACVDDDPKEIVESNENNNCSDVLSIEVKATQLTCSDCGKQGVFNGILNTCDDKECSNLGDCVFLNGFLGLTNKCFNQADCKAFCQKQTTNYVCSNNEKTYVNECMAKCDKQSVSHSGQCGQQVIDCALTYGAGWWCGVYDDWKGQCSGGGTHQLLSNKDTCKETGEKYCITCGVKTTFKAQSAGDNIIAIEGAQVSLTMSDETLGDSKVSCLTGKDGTCSIVLIPGAKYSLSALSNGYSCSNCANSAFTAKLDDIIHTLSFNKITTATKCEIDKDCANLSCSTNQSSQCVDAQCVCKDNVVSMERISCQQVYGNGWWCGSYDDWKGQCYGSGDYKELVNQTCNGRGDGFCNTCGVKASFSAITSDKTPLAGVQISASQTNVPGNKNTTCVTGSNGMCSMSLIPEDVYSVSALFAQYKCLNCSNSLFTALLDDSIHILVFDKATIKCSTNNNCANLACQNNQVPQCVDAQCVCKDATAPEVINCQEKYGKDYQCNTYAYWQKNCLGGSKFVELLNGAVCDDLGAGRGCFTCPNNISTTTPTSTPPVISPTSTLPAPGLINCQYKYNPAYWCSNYVDWTKECAGRADPNAIKQEGFCNESGGDYCVTCGSSPKPLSVCSDCGKQGLLNGLFNLCDVKECQGLGSDCVFSGGKCSVQSEIDNKAIVNETGITISSGTFLKHVNVVVATIPISSVEDVDKLSGVGKVVQVFDFSITYDNGAKATFDGYTIPIQISYADKYASGEINKNNEDNQKIYIYNQDTREWEALATTIDKKSKLLKAQAKHFTNTADVLGSNPCDPCTTETKDTSGGCYGPLSCVNGQCQPDSPVICSLTKFDNPDKLIDNISGWIFKLALIIAPLLILLGGFYMLTAAGDPSKSTQGKKIITWALIGLAVILAAKAFISIITSVLK